MKKGFTLIELLVFIAIFTLIIGSFIAILVSVVNIQTREVAISEVEQQGQFLTQQIEYYVQSARLVDMPLDTATTTLTLREATSSFDPTVITVSTGTIYIKQGAGASFQPLTSAKVSVTNVSFTRHYNANSTSSAFGTDSISYSFTVVDGSATSTQSSELFQSSVAVLAPVPKIAMLQQTKGESNNASVSNIVTAFPANNESGDLLVAVVGHSGLGTSSITDTLGNTWTLLYSLGYPAYSNKFALYYALNSLAGANTTTVTFAAGSGYGAVFLYEYRGASTVSSADSVIGQIQANTSTPSSGLVSPTSTAELLMGIDYNANTNEVPSAGAGYTLESSSTANNTTQMFIEDENQYISDPVSAGWNYSGSPSSTAVIATFK